MVVDAMTRRLGLDNKHKAMHKTGSTEFTYAEGQLSQNKDGLIFTLSAVDTLAVCNLLAAHYQEIVQCARAEQRCTEELNGNKYRGHYTLHTRKQKPPKGMV